ncbi:hypothetical protein C8T65DRAFT_833793 [Cerioporus squamosus]|nr:hypothetical protein C8T65DRAFT_833793 [Cerioporus squamosus]
MRREPRARVSFGLGACRLLPPSGPCSRLRSPLSAFACGTLYCAAAILAVVAIAAHADFTPGSERACKNGDGGFFRTYSPSPAHSGLVWGRSSVARVPAGVV